MWLFSSGFASSWVHDFHPFFSARRESSFQHSPSPHPAGTTSIRFPQLAYVAATWRSRREFRRGRSTQLDTKGLVSIVSSIRPLFNGTRYWVLEYLLADASDFVSRLDTFFESRGLARDAVFPFSLLSPACKFLDSGRAARAGSSFPVVSSCASPAPLSVRSPSLRGDDHVPGVSTHLGNSSHHSSSSGVTGLQPVLSGGAAFDGEKSFEHSPPPGDEKVWIHTSQPDESERLSDQAHLQGIPRGTASVDVEHAPSPGFSSSTSKRKFPRELNERAGRRFTFLDPIGELASVRGIGLSSTSSQTRQSLQSPPVRGRPGGFDGNGGRSSPVVVTSPSVFGSLVR